MVHGERLREEGGGGGGGSMGERRGRNGSSKPAKLKKGMNDYVIKPFVVSCTVRNSNPPM